MTAEDATMSPTIHASSGAHKRCKDRIVAPGPGRRYCNVVPTPNIIARFVRGESFSEGQEMSHAECQTRSHIHIPSDSLPTPDCNTTPTGPTLYISENQVSTLAHSH